MPQFPHSKEVNSIMRKSKAIAVIRKRKRNDGLAYRPKELEHPLLLALKAMNYFTEATIILMRMITEADDPEAMAKMMESEGLIKTHLDTANKLIAGINRYNERMEAYYNKNK